METNQDQPVPSEPARNRPAQERLPRRYQFILWAVRIAAASAKQAHRLHELGVLTYGAAR